MYRAVAERLANLSELPYSGVRFQQVDGRWIQQPGYRAHQDQQWAVHSFLTNKSSDDFLRVYLDIDPGLLDRLLDFGSYLNVVSEPGVLARLHAAGLLDEVVRRKAITQAAHLAVSTPDDGWIKSRAWGVLLTPEDRTSLMNEVRTYLIPRLEREAIWDDDEREEDDPFERVLHGYEIAFEDSGDFVTAQAFANARDAYCQLPVKAYDHDVRAVRKVVSAGHDAVSGPVCRPRMAMSRRGSFRMRRMVAAIFVCPACRISPIARLRRVAIILDREPVLIWDESSRKVTSRTFSRVHAPEVRFTLRVCAAQKPLLEMIACATDVAQVA